MQPSCVRAFMTCISVPVRATDRAIDRLDWMRLRWDRWVKSKEEETDYGSRRNPRTFDFLKEKMKKVGREEGKREIGTVNYSREGRGFFYIGIWTWGFFWGGAAGRDWVG